MAGEWRETALDQLGRIVTGKTPPSAREDCFGGDIPFVTPTDFDGRRKINSTGRYLTEEGAKSLSSSRIPAGSVMVSCIGSDMGKAALAATDCVTNQQINSIVVDPAEVPLFVYYNLSMRKAEIRNAASGSAQPILNKSAFGRLDILLPPANDQRAIAHILGTLDDKLELNRRMNETLEAMTRALFKSWFVDFNPVRAKAEGRDTGLPKPLADLFPDSFEDSELGKIPKGWVVGTLGVLGELAIGGDWGEDHSFAGAVEANCLRGVDLEHLRESGQASPPRRWFKPSSLERRAMDDRDVLVAGSGAGPTGRPLWMCTSLVSALEPSIYSNFCKRIRCGTAAGALYLDAWLHEMRQSREIWEYVNGTSVPNLDASSLLAGKEIPIPPIAVLDRYYGFVRPIREKLYSGQNRTLATLRDTLLPKLISGELRIEDAKRIIERATA